MHTLYVFLAVLILLVKHCTLVWSLAPKIPPQCTNFNGDFIIGGMFPVHIVEKNQTLCTFNSPGYTLYSIPGDRSVCTKINLSGLMWVEAMLYTISEINNRSDILPNMSLGYDIRDSLNNADYATNISLEFVLKGKRCLCGDNIPGIPGRKISAVVGGAGSKMSKSAQYILSVNSIPQISYSSTSPSLSDKSQFPSFLRTIPPDTYQARAIADLVTYYNWTYVSTIATDEDYGRLGIDAFKEAVKPHNVCISVDDMFHPDITSQSTRRKIKEIIRKLKDDVMATTVVLFCERPNALAVLEEAVRQNLTGKTWIGTESWGDNESVRKLKSTIVGGMLGVLPWHGDIPEFEHYMRTLTPRDTRHNPWFQEYWETKHDCEFDESGTVSNCSGGSRLLPQASSLQLNKAPNVMDAVYAVAMALHNLTTQSQLGKTGAANITPVNLLIKVRESDFLGKLGYPTKFDMFGDPMGKYEIKNLQPDQANPGEMRFVTIGQWDGVSSKLRINPNITVHWNGWANSVPNSRCSTPCLPGTYTVLQATSCCWKCVKCRRGYITQSPGQRECVPCGLRFMSNEELTKCINMPEIYVTWESTTGISIIFISTIGIALNIFVFAVFYRNRFTAIVKASNKELSFLILFITSLMFLTPVLYTGRPTLAACLVRPYFFGFILTLCTSLMLTKTYRLLSIFTARRPVAAKKRTSVGAQVLFALFLGSVLLSVITIWICVYQPTVRLLVLNEQVIIDCGEEERDLYVVILAYVACIAFTATCLAYKVRNLPANFNEARHICFSTFTLCVLWLILIPCYYDVLVKYRTAFLSFGIIFTGFDMLVCMFTSRVLIIILKPELNTKEKVRAEMFRYNTSIYEPQSENEAGNRKSVCSLGLSVDPRLSLHLSTKL